MKHYSDLFITVFFAALFLTAGITIHEIRHADIYRSHGCNTSYHILQENALASVSADCPRMTTGQKRYLSTLQENVETTGYHLMPLYLATGFILGILASIKTRIDSWV